MEFRLKDRCRILRCCWPRGKRFDHDARVITQYDIDPCSGLVNVAGARHEKISRAVEGSQYELKQGDIVLTHNGAPSTIGKCGYVVDNGTCAVPTSTMALVRPGGIDPVWLFFRLRQMEDRLKEMACLGKNGASWFLPLEKLGEIRLAEPSASIVKEVNDLFGEIREKSVQRGELADEMGELSLEIARLIGEN